MTIKRWLLVLFYVLSFYCHGQSKCDSCLYKAIKSYKRLDIPQLSNRVQQIEPLKLKQFFKYELAYLASGDTVSSSLLSLNGLNDEDLIFAKGLLGDFINRNQKSKTDTLAFALFRESFEEASKTKNTILINEILRKLNAHLFLFGDNLEEYYKYIQLYKEFSNDSVDRFHVALNEMGHRMLLSEDLLLKIPDSSKYYIEEKFSEMESNAIHPYHIATINNFKGIYFSAFIGNQTRALSYYEKAKENYKQSPYYFSLKGLNGIAYNIATIQFENKEYEKSIESFKGVLNLEKELHYRAEAYDWIQKAYDSLGDYKNAHLFFLKLVKAKDSVDKLDKSKFIADLEHKYDFKEKEIELATLVKNNKQLMNRQHILIPILLGVLVLAGLGFFLYKKSRYKSKLLEGEQSETLKRLDEIKKIVIKNHIVLKDKRKVYVADLMYIKSEDHYLNLFLNDGNNYFVRGRLKDIKEELPPNFIQCHRSFIVNRNFVKQQLATVLLLLNNEKVPVSRGYNKNL